MEETKLSDANRETLKNFIIALCHNDADYEPKPDIEKIIKEVEDYILGLPFIYKTSLTTMIRLLELGTIAKGYRHSFSKLDPEQQKEYLISLEQSKNYALRGIVMAVKILVILVYFSREEVEKAIGFDGKCLLDVKSKEQNSQQGQKNILPDNFFFH